MEGIVAKRTLKKSYYNRNINNLNADSTFFYRTKESSKENKNIFQTYKVKWIYKTCIQAITMITIIAFVVGIRLLKINIVLEADITRKLANHYQKTYSLNQICDSAKTVLKSTYIFVKPVIPNEVEDKVKQMYRGIFINKKKDTTGNEINNKENSNEVEIYEEININNKENTVKENVGVSVDENEEEEKIIAVSSSISSELNIVDKIKESKTDFVKPVKGTVTSHFGAREVIFEGINSYHTGTDIGANTGTKVVSSISGKVTRATYNKYNGNFVEVTNGEIATIYCHMSKLNVDVGDNVKAGTKIGEVGSTGLSTGPHLHFEIVYDGTKVDPELVIDL